jgi:Leucine-rich repeat (LRR) protein
MLRRNIIFLMLIISVFLFSKFYYQDSQKSFMKYCTSASGNVLQTIRQLDFQKRSLKETCNFIYEDYILNDKNIIVMGKGKITDLEVFKFFKSSNVNLMNNDIIDVSPLAEMTNLKVANLSGNPISDIVALADLH